MDEAERLGERRARNHSARPECQRLSRRRAGRAAVAAWRSFLSSPNRRHRAAALHDLASARHGRRIDRGASRSAEADAVFASAGAIGLGSHSGSMNRHHTREDYLRIIDRLRAARPDIALSSDFIVGFPGETRRGFRGDARPDRRDRLLRAFSFKYSPRRARPAPMDDQIDEDMKSDRLHRLQAASTAIRRLQPLLSRPHFRRAVRKAGPL